jgi:hypothetical protein
MKYGIYNDLTALVITCFPYSYYHIAYLKMFYLFLNIEISEIFALLDLFNLFKFYTDPATLVIARFPCS